MPQITPSQLNLNSSTLIGRMDSGKGQAREISLGDSLLLSSNALSVNLSTGSLANALTSLYQYVDSAVQGIDAKPSARTATQGPITLSGGQTIAGVAVVAGDIVLVKNQTDVWQNGLYVVSASSWNRAPQMDAWSEVPSAYVFVESGTLGGTGWVCTSASGGTLGSTPITWVQFSGAGTYTAGAMSGLAITGIDISLVPSVARSVLSISNVDNTSDANKPISTATQNALNLKANLSGAAFTGAISGTSASFSGITSGDIYSSRSSNSGVIFLGSSGSHYLFWNGTNYSIPNGPLLVGGALTSDSISTGDISSRDIIAQRNASTGIIYLGGNLTHYLYFDGTQYNMPSGNLNLGGAITATNIGTAASYAIGTSGATVPLLNGSNTWTGNQIWNGTQTVNSGGITITGGKDVFLDVNAYSNAIGENIGHTFFKSRGQWYSGIEGYVPTGASGVDSVYLRFYANSVERMVLSVSGLSITGTLATTGALSASNFSGSHSGSSSGTNTGDQTSVSGNAGTATQLLTARTISTTGDLSWSTTFDGSANVSATATLANVNPNTGTFGSSTAVPVLTLDTKGRVTAASTVSIGGAAAYNIGTSGNTIPLLSGANTWSTTQIFSGIIGIGTSAPSQPLDVNGTIRAGQSSTSGSVILVGSYDSTYLAAWGTEYSSGAPFMGYGVKPSTTAAASFRSSIVASQAQGRSAIVAGSGNIRLYTGASQGVAVDAAVATTEMLRVEGSSYVSTASQIRATGWYGATSSAPNGLALEIGVSGAAAFVYSYNRDTASYTPLVLGGSTITAEKPLGFSGTSMQVGNSISAGFYGDGTNVAVRTLNVGGSQIYFQGYNGSSTYATMGPTFNLYVPTTSSSTLTVSKIGIGTTSLSYDIQTGGSRPLFYDSNGGSMSIKGDGGGWAMGYFFQGSGGTNRGGFGANGGTDNLSYYYIGQYGSELSKWASGGSTITTALTVNGAATFSNGVTASSLLVNNAVTLPEATTINGYRSFAYRGALAVGTPDDNANLMGAWGRQNSSSTSAILSFETGGTSTGLIQMKINHVGDFWFRNKTDNNTFTTYKRIWHDGDFSVDIGVSGNSLVKRGASGGINVQDIRASRGDGTGVIYFGTTDSRYLYYDGSQYQMPGTSLYVGNHVYAAGNLYSTNGYVVLNGAANRFLQFDGANYQMPGSGLFVGGQLTANGINLNTSIADLQTFLISGRQQRVYGGNKAAGWYTIAANVGNRASARIGLRDISSGNHQSVVLYANHLFGNGNTINVISQSRYNGSPFRYIRIKSGGTYDGAMLQVYIDGDNSACDVEAYILGDNFQDSSGWVLVNWVADGTNPGTVSSFSTLTTVSQQIDLDRCPNGASVSGNFLATNLLVGSSSATSMTTPTSIKMDNSYRSTTGSSDNLKFYLFNNGLDNYGFGLNAAAGIEYHASNSTAGNHAFYVGGSLRATVNNTGLDMGGYPTYYTNTTYNARFKTGGKENDSDGIASITVSNGNIHLDCATGYGTYINHFRGGVVNIGNGSGVVQYTFDSNDLSHPPSGGLYMRNNKAYTVSGQLTFNGSNVFNPVQSIKSGFISTGVGTNSGVSGVSAYQWGYQEAGDWNYPYPDLVIGFHTGMKMGAVPSYGGIRFYDNHPSVSTTELFSIGNGDSNVRVANTLYATSVVASAITSTSGSITAAGAVLANGGLAVNDSIIYLRGNGDSNHLIQRGYESNFGSVDGIAHRYQRYLSLRSSLTGKYSMLTNGSTNEIFFNEAGAQSTFYGSVNAPQLTVNNNPVWQVGNGQTAANFLFNNNGSNHGSFVDMNASPVFGARFYGGATTSNTPTGNGDYYTVFQGLGYNYSSNDYGIMMALARGGNDYLWLRRREGAGWQGWYKVRAGYADSAGDSSSLGGTAASGYSQGTQANYANSAYDGGTSQLLRWKNYGTNHVIFDASQQTSPNGSSVNRQNSQVPWSDTYPTLMGWNGSNTYGVRVDSCRTSDTLQGLSPAYTNAGNTMVQRTGDGHIYCQNVNSAAGIDDGTGIDGIFYGNPDGFLRKSSPTRIKNLFAAIGTTVWTAENRFRSNYDTSNGNSPPLQAYSDNNSGAVMAFHRGGAYAVNMGLDSDNVFRIGGWSASGNRLQMDMSGNLTMAGNITAYSDARLKTNIRTIDQALDRVCGMRGVWFTHIESNQESSGVVAQEFQKQAPELVLEDNSGTLSVNYGAAAGYFIEAFKEMKALVDEQREMIDTLRSELDAMRGGTSG